MELKKEYSNQTPLSVVLTGSRRPQVAPIDVFKLARKCWLQGKTVSISELAKELGVGRARIHRWVGRKALLLLEIIWSLAGPTFAQAIKDTPGHGIDHIVGVHHHFLKSSASFKPLQQFIKKDPATTLRVLTSASGVNYERTIKAIADHLNGQATQGYIKLPTSANKLAEVFVKTNGALIYNDLFDGREPNIQRTRAMCHIMLSNNPFPPNWI